LLTNAGKCTQKVTIEGERDRSNIDVFLMEILVRPDGKNRQMAVHPAQAVKPCQCLLNDISRAISVQHQTPQETIRPAHIGGATSPLPPVYKVSIADGRFTGSHTSPQEGRTICWKSASGFSNDGNGFFAEVRDQ
jgi:hypothetical protein